MFECSSFIGLERVLFVIRQHHRIYNPEAWPNIWASMNGPLSKWISDSSYPCLKAPRKRFLWKNRFLLLSWPLIFDPTQTHKLPLFIWSALQVRKFIKSTVEPFCMSTSESTQFIFHWNGTVLQGCLTPLRRQRYFQVPLCKLLTPLLYKHFQPNIQSYSCLHESSNE